MKFLGIDLGWRSQPSGLCCLALQGDSLKLLSLCRLDGIDEILVWVDTWTGENTEAEAGTSHTGKEPAGIAVDAPTLIPNLTGMRLPDRLTHQHFGRYHAGCYPANRSLPFAERTISFGLSLEARGFAHAPSIQPRQPCRFQIEVFPHPATVNLFGLSQIFKYKKGRLADRRSELEKLHHCILTILPTLEPRLDLGLDLGLDLEPDLNSPAQALPAVFQTVFQTVPQTGAALKALEDQLDGLLCAYVAAHWWYWGLERNLVLGAETPEASCQTGYIVVPRSPSRSVT